MEKRFINPIESMGFTQVVTVAAGEAAGLKTIYISGQVGEGEDMATQSLVAFKRLRKQLTAAGATPADVVKINVFIVDLKPEDLAGYGEGKAQVFGDLENQPASTVVGVTALVMPQFRIEVEAVAVVEA